MPQDWMGLELAGRWLEPLEHPLNLTRSQGQEERWLTSLRVVLALLDWPLWLAAEQDQLRLPRSAALGLAQRQRKQLVLVIQESELPRLLLRTVNC